VGKLFIAFVQYIRIQQIWLGVVRFEDGSERRQLLLPIRDWQDEVRDGLSGGGGLLAAQGWAACVMVILNQRFRTRSGRRLLSA
jgi:hypothetical protein